MNSTPQGGRTSSSTKTNRGPFTSRKMTDDSAHFSEDELLKPWHGIDTPNPGATLFQTRITTILDLYSVLGIDTPALPSQTSHNPLYEQSFQNSRLHPRFTQGWNPLAVSTTDKHRNSSVSYSQPSPQPPPRNTAEINPGDTTYAIKKRLDEAMESQMFSALVPQVSYDPCALKSRKSPLSLQIASGKGGQTLPAPGLGRVTRPRPGAGKLHVDESAVQDGPILHWF